MSTNGAGPAIPTGVVTFMFTDIAGSTELLARLGRRATPVFAAHDRIVRGAVRTVGGYEVRTEGDSFFLAFERPTDALACARAIQRSLRAYPWPDGGEVWVRIGMHTGEADVHGRGYVGLAVHLAARIAHMAPPGLILLSGATAQLVGRLPGAELRDWGWRSLKGFRAPERVYEVHEPALARPVPV